MGVLPLISLSLPLQTHLHSPSAKTQLQKPDFWPKLSSSIYKSVNFSSKTAKLRSKSNDPAEIDPMFLDKNGVVDDMETYLNSLSLEYDSVWDTKPSWCQPWTISLTGVSVIAGSWLVLHSIVITALVSSLICAWWYIFLYSYPKTYSDMISERRERVKSGSEDTYGWSKKQ
ncbi:hypothetical protein BVRB_5g119320 [Beta vulgaris subsp. vulgaris]|nr:hypothetical protein BVRB_5g119320 [Beta vulgaris subsp. vulgaris]